MRVDKKRRKQSKTDYSKRIKLLKSGSPRVVFRKTNKYVISQYVTSKEAQDKIEFGVNSKDLIKYGWPKEFKGSLKSIPASYLVGFLIGKKIIKQKLENPIVDLGMLRILYKTKVYGFLKGLKDSGIKIKCEDKMFPEEDRIKGKNLKKDFSKTFEEIKSKIEKE
ncbi:50S ribosomal protein L18 [Candidatus Pacearchaeota archaeon]|nr:50S ribosomal protein L18 [Candidatus Pacearchaeota archaeon]